jgi:putative lipase involved disintegration of autophagic bodies
MVHAGFREACDSISRRLKELVLAAVDGELSEWDLLITGHSLGGALATLFTTDLAVRDFMLAML